MMVPDIQPAIAEGEVSQSLTMEHNLATLPQGATLRSVIAVPGHIAGRDALRVELTDDVTRLGKPRVDYGDQPTFAVLPVHLENGTISVDILGRLRPDAPEVARAFAGIAYRIADNGQSFECVYLRPLNGHKVNPPPPRHVRAIQYFAYPEWGFDRLREQYPDGRYEAGADIGPEEWINLSIRIDGQRIEIDVNGGLALLIEEAKAGPVSGAIGLWVDIGTQAFFSNLRVMAR